MCTRIAKPEPGTAHTLTTVRKELRMPKQATGSTAPLIDPGLLSDDRDVAGMLAGLRLARAAGTSPALAPWRKSEVFPGVAVQTGDQLRRSGSVGTYFHPVGTCKLGIDPDAVV